MGAVDDQAALVPVLNCVTFEHAVLARSFVVKVEAVLAQYAALPTLFHARVRHARRVVAEHGSSVQPQRALGSLDASVAHAASG